MNVAKPSELPNSDERRLDEIAQALIRMKDQEDHFSSSTKALNRIVLKKPSQSIIISLDKLKRRYDSTYRRKITFAQLPKRHRRKMARRNAINLCREYYPDRKEEYNIDIDNIQKAYAG